MPPNFCTTCGWILGLEPMASDGSSEALKDSKKIDWAKQAWARSQAAELRARQAESATGDRENQIDDLQSRIDLLQRRLERLTLEKEKAKDEAVEAARQQERERVGQLKAEIAQLRQTLQRNETESQQLQSELQNQLGERQNKIEGLERRLQQVTAEKDKAQEMARQLEQEQVRQLETEVSKLQRRLQVVETANGQLETNLQKQQIQNVQNDRQQQELQAKLHEAKEQVKHLAQLERMAQTALSQWLQSDLFDRFVAEVESITDRGEALDRIKRLQQKRLNQEWHDRPVYRHLLQLVIDFLEQKGQQKENLQQELENSHAIIVVDAVLAIRAELRYDGIIQRDGAGDYFGL